MAYRYPTRSREERREAFKVVIDTNFIVQLGEGSITLGMLEDALVSRYELIVPASVLDEARRLFGMTGKTISRKVVKGLEIIERKGFSIAEHSRSLSADKAVIEVAYRLKKDGKRVVVATSDREVRRVLRKIGVPTVYLRESKGLLEVDWLPP
ncbi:MAG: hypothetical protein F7C07_02170 [Desulfurococcales archaeon]|nr:hypothetical protein [Desulfurococcales archaeon]